MAVLIIDDMADSAAWAAFEPDGTTPSQGLRIEEDTREHGSGADRVSGRVSAAPDALGHLLRRDLVAVDLSDFVELRVALRTPARTGRSGFLLELRLASSARPFDDAPTTWHRLLPVTGAGRWETVYCTLDDLPRDVAAAVTGVQLRCVQAPFEANVDDLVAVDPQPLLDTDRALVTALSGVTVDGTAVTAVVRGPDENAGDGPGIDLRHVDARFAPQRVVDAAARRDHTATGSREATAGTPYDLDYVVSVRAGTRAVQAALLEAVLARLPVDEQLPVGGESRPIRLLASHRADVPDDVAQRRPARRYRVAPRGPARVGSAVAEVHRVEVSTELQGI